MRLINSIMEVPGEGSFSDIMWSDPTEDIKGWYSPSPRGAGYLFGELITEEFNHINGLDLIARAHQLCHQGYNFMHNHKLVTVWSAPNYSYRCGNSASICMVTDKLTRHFQVFTKSED